MPFVRIWVHLIWTTKNREPLISPDLREKLLEHIQKNAEDKNISLDLVNMFINHAHALILMKSNETIAKIAQLIKGESSHWVNEMKLFRSNLNGRMNILPSQCQNLHLKQSENIFGIKMNTTKKINSTNNMKNSLRLTAFR